MAWSHAAGLIGAAGVLAGGILLPEPPKKVNFKSDVLPILRAHCMACHTEGSAYGRLRLDTEGQIKRGGKSGPLWSGTDPKNSLLIQRVRGLGAKEQMPKGFAPLSEDKIKTLEAWVKEGAHFEGEAEQHWAYVSPVKPPVPKTAAHPIDAFIASKLAEEKLKPSPPAPPATLLRRVYLDLVGLPPTLEEADAFLKNPSKDAYLKVVDDLLSRSQFGEKTAMPWLDLARYADSNGYEKDSNRTIWPYRDWVINAFNRDLPYPRFIEEQLAGDMLPDATKDTLIATGFQRNTMLNQEGGVDQGEQRWLTLIDRVAVTGSVFLASSIACAQCHDHKYDPISQKDFYKMLAYYESASEPAVLLDPEKMEALEVEASRLNKDLTQNIGKPAEKEIKDRLAAIEGKKRALWDTRSTLVLKEDAAKKAETLFRNKGAYLSPGDPVPAGLPTFLTPPGRQGPENRLTLARWIGSRENPLTARVYVNRLWEKVFGVGLVKTSDDFGTQGEMPKHQALLDWLAVEFMDRGWSTKAMLRLIVTSEAYQRSSVVPPDMADRDPDNRLLARGPRFRLPAESIRDNALAASGLLSAKVGGPSVMPDQPEGVWDLPYSGERWVRSEGEDRWRRGLYTHWKRSAPYPMFAAFDATSREACTTKRVRTNTPLQALAILNDEALLEAARALAARSWAPGGKGVEDAFRRVMVRRPTAAERDRLEKLAKTLTARYEKDPEGAKKIAGGEGGAVQAARVLTAHAILNLDEAITKE